MPPILSVSRAAEVLVDRAREMLRRAPKTAGETTDDFGRALAKADVAFPRWLRHRRAGARQYVELALPHLAALRATQPGPAAATVAAAEVFLQHQFDLLGSGTFSPIDPDRLERGGYRPIDWYLDPVRQLRFPSGVPYKEWKLYEMRPGNADVKYPWELARSYHWVTLAQAWQLSRDVRFAREIADQLDDFVEANPVGVGINWTCTMDVAIRAANWCLAIALVLDCTVLDESFWRQMLMARSTTMPSSFFRTSKTNTKSQAIITSAMSSDCTSWHANFTILMPAQNGSTGAAMPLRPRLASRSTTRGRTLNRPFRIIG